MPTLSENLSALASRIGQDMALRAKTSALGTAAFTNSTAYATAAQGTLANSAVQPAREIIAGTGLTGGGTLAANRTIALNSTSIASLAKADTAVQPARAISAGTGLTGGGDLSANRSLALSAASIASLAKADTAIQAPGGAAGQILAKNSGTTNDVAWVSSEAATAVSYAPQVLTPAQQGQAVANIGAGALSGFRNKILNGNFDVWQRGVGPFGNNAFNADRWLLAAGTGSTNSVDRLSSASTPIRGLSTYRLRWARPTPGSGASVLLQKIEDVRTLEGKRATLTFWASQSSGLPLSLSARQIFGSGGSAEVPFTIAPQFDSPGTPNTWAKYSFSFDVPSVSDKTIGDGSYLEVRFVRPNTGGLATATFYLSRVSLVEGDATAEADPFSPRHIQQELALCQRYYEVSGGNYSFTQTVAGPQYNSWGFKVEKRATPSVSIVVGSGSPAFLAASATHFIMQFNAASRTDTSFQWAADAELI